MRPQVIKTLRIVDSEGKQIFREDGKTPLEISMDENDYLDIVASVRDQNPELSEEQAVEHFLNGVLLKAIEAKKAES